MSSRNRKALMFALRWGVAVVGIWIVLNGIWFRDHVSALIGPKMQPVELALAAPAAENSAVFVLDNGNNARIEVPARNILNKPTLSRVLVRTQDGRKQHVLGMRVNDRHQVEQLLVVRSSGNQPPRWITPADLKHPDRIPAYRNRIEPGLISLVSRANPSFLWAAILIFPLTFLITSLRWHALLRALEIRITQSRTFVLNMVGAFYNSFMLGSTGGDVLKAYYIARQTDHRTRAVISVLVDRVVGLLALIILGGVMAAIQWQTPECRNVALACGALMAGVAGALTLFYVPSLRRLVRLDALLRRLPMRNQVHKAVEALEIYGRRPWLVLGTLLMTFPVHITVIISAMLAGMAFNLPLPPSFYWVVVPVVVLVGAIPISPQGAGVMEAFAWALMKGTWSEAVVLSMSIRLIQIFWNLTGGVFVFRGGYHAPTQSEQQQLAVGDEELAGGDMADSSAVESPSPSIANPGP